MRYLGLGVQLAAMVGIMAWLGYKTDGWVETEKPWFTLSFSILGVVMAMIYMVREIPRL